MSDILQALRFAFGEAMRAYRKKRNAQRWAREPLDWEDPSRGMM